MAKETTSVKQPKFEELKNTFRFFPFKSQKAPFIVIILLGLIFNLTTLNNEYALDDGIIIHQNDHVIKGIAGIKGILTKDAYESFYRKMNATDQLAGGRYRPLSVVSFAIEQQFIGAYPKDGNYPAACWRSDTANFKLTHVDDPKDDINNDGVFNEVDCQVKGASIRHFVNIISFIIGIMLLFLFFRNYIFKDNHDLAFLAAILFLMHPLHSEAIANVKSRDEIFSLIFISLTLFYSFRFVDYANYIKEEGLLSKASASIKQLCFAAISIIVLGFAYLFLINTKDIGILINLPTIAIGGLIIYSCYLTLIKGEKLPKNIMLAWAVICFLLALLAKEYAVVLIALMPVAFYVFGKIEFDYKTFTKSPDFMQTLFVFGSFVIAALFMLFVKRSSDIHIQPGQKATMAFWLFPFLYLVIGVFLLGSKTKTNFGKLMTWQFFIMLFYLGMRLVAVKLKPGVPDTEILNNPYLLATGEERFMTKAFVLLKYIGLCWFPHPLTSDYSFNTIQYRHFTSWDSILSIVLHISLAYYGVKLVIRKHIMGFAIATYFAFLLMIGNILMDIGATMGERLLFHSTIGFCIALAWLILKGFDSIPNMAFKAKQVVFFLILGTMTFLYGCKTWERNWDWKNDITLFLKDVEIIPNSVLVLGNAGARYIDLADTKTFVENPADTNLIQLKELNPHPVEPNYGTIEKLGQKIKPIIGSIEVYHVDSVDKVAFNRKRTAFLEKGLKYLKHAVELHPRYVNGYLNLGLGSYKLGRDRDALYYWKHAEHLYPNNPYLKNYYIVFYNDLLQRGYKKAQRGQVDSAIYELNKTIILDKLNPEGFYNLGGAYYQKGNYAKAKYYWEQCVKINPNYTQAVNGLKTIVTVTVPTQPVPSQPVSIKH
jgi:tetratricopeptide (TPR) repeat protein